MKSIYGEINHSISYETFISHVLVINDNTTTYTQKTGAFIELSSIFVELVNKIKFYRGINLSFNKAGVISEIITEYLQLSFFIFYDVNPVNRRKAFLCFFSSLSKIIYNVDYFILEDKSDTLEIPLHFLHVVNLNDLSSPLPFCIEIADISMGTLTLTMSGSIESVGYMLLSKMKKTALHNLYVALTQWQKNVKKEGHRFLFLSELIDAIESNMVMIGNILWRKLSYSLPEDVMLVKHLTEDKVRWSKGMERTQWLLKMFFSNNVYEHHKGIDELKDMNFINTQALVNEGAKKYQFVLQFNKNPLIYYKVYSHSLSSKEEEIFRCLVERDINYWLEQEDAEAGIEMLLYVTQKTPLKLLQDSGLALSEPLKVRLMEEMEL